MQDSVEIISQMVAKAKAMNLSNQQWANQSGASKSTVDKIVRGETLNPSLQTVMDMAAVVGITVFTPVEELEPDGVRPKDPVYEDRITRMRAFYNGLLAEKEQQIAKQDRALLFAGKIILGLVVALIALIIALTVVVHIRA